MKKLFILIVVIVSTTLLSNEAQAQSNWEAGFRWPAENFSVEATIPIGIRPRFHPAVYFENFGIGAYFDWVFSLDGGPEGLKFYLFSSC